MEITHARRRNRVLLVLFVGVLMGALDIAIVGPALPAIERYFGVDDRAGAWLFTIYVLFSLVSTPLMAKLSDVCGRRLIYTLDVGLFSLGSLVVALSPAFGVLLVGRAVQGLGAGGIFPVASAVIGDTFPREQRGRALGMIGAVFGLAFIIGPVLGGVLLMFGWRWLFLVNLPVAAVVMGLSLRLLPATRPARRQPFDWTGMAVLGLLLASFIYGLNQVDTAHLWRSVTSRQVWPFLLAATVLLPAFRRAEQRAADPVLRLGLFARRQVRLASVLAVGAGLTEGVLVFVPAFLVAAFGVSSSTASFMLVPVVFSLALGAPLAGRLLDALGSRVVVTAGTVLLTVGMVVLGLLATSLVFFYLAALMLGLGLSSLLGAPLRYIMLNETPVAERAAAQGAVSLFTRVGQLTSGALVGAVAASQGGGVAGYQAAYLFTAAVALVLVLVSFGLKNRAQELATVQQHEAGNLGRGGARARSASVESGVR